KSMGNGKVVEEVESQIVRAGRDNGKNYKVDHKILNAADYGVPQLRKRLIFIGASENYGIRWPKKIFNSAKDYLTIKDAIGDLPSLKPNEEKVEYKFESTYNYQKLMRGNCEKIINNKAPNHPKATIERIKNTVPGEPMYPNYKQRIRLQWDNPSPTQVSGGIRPQFQFGHPEDDRGLTIRERARIQSFPDNYEFLGGTVQGRVQTGNAVPPLLAKAIAKELLKELKNPNPRKKGDLLAF
ncbi:MAG: DNA cytosine methyltransferase, partial [Methanobacteriaceae archaeon]